MLAFPRSFFWLLLKKLLCSSSCSYGGSKLPSSMKCALYPILQKLGRGRELLYWQGDFWIMATRSSAEGISLSSFVICAQLQFATRAQLRFGFSNITHCISLKKRYRPYEVMFLSLFYIGVGWLLPIWAFLEGKLTLGVSCKKGKEELLRFLQLARDAFLAQNFDRFIDS